MITEQQEAIAAEVFAALESGTLVLPTLPDMAIKIRKAIDDPNISAEALIRLLSTDPAISAHIIKTANSAAFSGGHPVNELRAAISRLGYSMLRNMVMAITMNKLFKAESPIINQELKNLWDHSREVAANSYVLASRHQHLKPEQAMLAGLVHDLGALPLCIYADHHHPRLDQETLEGLIRKFHTETGVKLLESWHFPHELVEVAALHENLQHTTVSGLADYVDVVTAANLLMPGAAKFVAWENVAAVSRLGYSPAECRNFLDAHSEQLAAAHELMGISAPKPHQPPQRPTGIKAPAVPRSPSKAEPATPKPGMWAILFKWFR